MDLQADPPPLKTANPLLEKWSGPFGAPPFAAIEPAHFRAAS
jgi:hypothetical protein